MLGISRGQRRIDLRLRCAILRLTARMERLVALPGCMAGVWISFLLKRCSWAKPETPVTAIWPLYENLASFLNRCACFYLLWHEGPGGTLLAAA